MKNKNQDATKDIKPEKKRVRAMSILVPTLLVSAAVVVLIVYPPVRAKAAIKARNAVAAIVAAAGNGGSKDNSAWGGTDATLKFQNNLAAKFAVLELRDSDYEIRYLPKDSVIEIKASIPRGRPMEWVVHELTGVASATPFTLYDCVCTTPAQLNCTMTFKSEKKGHPAISLNLRQSSRPRSDVGMMAILIENFGFEADKTTAEFLSFPEPLTVSLAPAQKLAEWTAVIADEYNKEVVLLLPMEPLPAQIAGMYRGTTINIHTSEDGIRNIISQAAAAIPNFSGISNFHGSKVMEDSRVMGIILSEASKRKAYFVYTDISRKSIVPQMVRDMKFPSHAVQGVISADHNAEQTRDRLRRFSMTAEKTGKVLVKAPPTQTFIQVLNEEKSVLKSNGIRLVYVSELIK